MSKKSINWSAIAESIKDSYLEEFLANYQEILETKNFVEPDRPIEEGDEIIDEMTEHEKILDTIAVNLVNKANTETESMRKLADEYIKNFVKEREQEGKKYSAKELNETFKKAMEKFTEEHPVANYHPRIDILQGLLWFSIRQRIKSNASTIGIRQGYKIVSCKDDEPCDCSIHIMAGVGFPSFLEALKDL